MSKHQILILCLLVFVSPLVLSSPAAQSTESTSSSCTADSSTCDRSLYRQESSKTYNIALHAQSHSPSHGWVAGSEITTLGLRSALLSHYRQQDIPINVDIFAPFSYASLKEVSYDLVIIEGYIGTVPNFIQAIRRINPDVVVLHYMLDTYPSVESILSLDVDGFLTNSLAIASRRPNFDNFVTGSEHGGGDYHSRQGKVASEGNFMFVPLAVDTVNFRPLNMKINESSEGNNDYSGIDNKYSDIDVVYLGQWKTTKRGLLKMLLSVAELSSVEGYNFALYGHGWTENIASFPELRPLLPYYRGVLPLEDIPELYSGAKVVLGATEEEQELMGMVNNRVFEVLAVGGRLVIPKFEGLEEVLGRGEDWKGGVYFVDDVDVDVDVDADGGERSAKNVVRGILQGEGEGEEGEKEEDRKSRIRRMIVEKHGWDSRVPQILRFRDELVRKKETNGALSTRLNSPRVAFIYNSMTDGYYDGNKIDIDQVIKSALKTLMAWKQGTFEAIDVSTYGEEMVLLDLHQFDFLLVNDKINGPIETAVRMNFAKVVGKRIGIIPILILDKTITENSREVLDHYDYVGPSLTPDFYSEVFSVPKKTASIRIIALDTQIVLSKRLDVTTFTVIVAIRHFTPPNDGVWCVFLSPEHLAVCIGDDNGGGVDPNTGDFITKVEMNRLDRFFSFKEGEVWDLEIYATLNGGDLEEPFVFKESERVNVRLVFK